MAKTKEQKHQDLEELTQNLSNAKSAVMAEYRGTTVKDMDKFRRSMTAVGVKAKVYKVTLLKKALEAMDIDSAQIDYKQPIILSWSDNDETAPARLVRDAGKDIKTISPLSGLLDNQFASKEQVMALADLPTKDDLRAKLVGAINAPLSGMVNVLAGNIRGLVNVLQAISQK